MHSLPPAGVVNAANAARRATILGARTDSTSFWEPHAAGTMPPPTAPSVPPHPSNSLARGAGGDGAGGRRQALALEDADAGSGAESSPVAPPSTKKVRWTEQATRQLLEQLRTSSTMYHSPKEKNNNKLLGKEYVRSAAALSRSKPAVLFTGPKVGAKIKNLSGSWRSSARGGGQAPQPGLFHGGR